MGFTVAFAFQDKEKFDAGNDDGHITVTWVYPDGSYPPFTAGETINKTAAWADKATYKARFLVAKARHEAMHDAQAAIEAEIKSFMEEV